MKNLLYSVLSLLLFSTSTFADHILGGDITYTHIEGLKYQINVTMFRDCGECSLRGKGGGDPEYNCGGFNLFIHTAESSLCKGDILVHTDTLIFSSYQPILKLCDNARSTCDDAPNFGYGVEAHYYTTIIDFANYSEYKGCKFDLNINTPMRKETLTNVAGNQRYFFVYSEINPWIPHSSPKFKAEPTLLLNCGKDFSESVIEGKQEGDSIKVSLVTPLRARTIPLIYESEYSTEIPLKVWCGGDINCKPNPASTPFKGFYVNQENGLVAFSPVKCNENAVVAYEVKKWVKDDQGKYQLVCRVRRDVQFTVSTLSANNAPRFAKGTADKLVACVGQSATLTINATDAVTMTPSGPLLPDTVRFEVINAPVGLNYTVKPIPDQPYFSLELNWTPDAGQVGLKYNVIVRVRDNACPANATNEMIIGLEAKPSPELSMLVQKLECGHIYFRESAGEGKWHWNLTCLTSDWTGDRRMDTLRITKPDTYRFTGTTVGINGCVTTEDTIISFSKDDLYVDLIDPASLDFAGCDKDTIHLEARIRTGEEFTAGWIMDGGMKEIPGKYVSLYFDQPGKYDEIKLWVETVRNGLACLDEQQVSIEVLPLPEINSWTQKEVCYGSPDIDLMKAVSPAYGTWFARHKSVSDWSLVENNTFSTTLWEHEHFDTEYLLEYRVTNPATGCSAKKPASVLIKRLPLMDLKDLDVCATGTKLSLKVLVERPYVYETGKFTWKGLDGITEFISDQNGDWIVIPSAISGKQRIVATNMTSFGCQNSDTGVINLLQEVKIALVDPGTICIGNEDIDLSDLTKLNNKMGNWYSYEKPDWVNNGILSSQACGQFKVGYIIDQFGCFDQHELTLDIRCSPEFKLNVPDTVCKNIGKILLDGKPLGGTWIGEGVRNTELDISMLQGNVDLVYSYLNGPCRYEATHTIYIGESPYAVIGDHPQSICDDQIIEVEGIYFNSGHWTIQTGNGVYMPDLDNHRLTYKPSIDEINAGVSHILFTGTGDGLCKAESYTISTRIAPTPIVHFESEEFEGCAPFELKIRTRSGNPNVYLSDVNFTWNFGDTNSGNDNVSDDQDPVHVYELPGTYDISLEARHDQGCIYQVFKDDLVKVWPTPVARFFMEPNGEIPALDPKVSFFNMSTGSSLGFEWNFGDGTNGSETDPVHTFPSDTGAYVVSLEATNEFGCSDVFRDRVYVGPDIRIIIPNAFTPNNKDPEENETFKVQGQNIRDLEIVIYNRWGEIMTEIKGLDQSWDGTYKGVPCMEGVYFYMIKAFSKTGKVYEYQGTLTLIR